MNGDISNSKRRKVYRYLDALRASGRTNMFAAIPCLIKRFKFNRDDATAILCEWMRDFNG